MNRATLRRIRSELPTIQCKGKCWPYCTPVHQIVDKSELERMVRARGYLPEPAQPDLCAFLANGRCTVYKDRPAVCELWGLAETTTCPWGCKPQPRYLTIREAIEFEFRLETGAGREEARLFVFDAEHTGLLQFANSPAVADQSWTPTIRAALLELLRQGRTDHLSQTTLKALEGLK